jgi:hypothetical protein
MSDTKNNAIFSVLFIKYLQKYFSVVQKKCLCRIATLPKIKKISHDELS